MTIKKADSVHQASRTPVWRFVIAAAAWVGIFPLAAVAANPDGDLRIEPIAAYNFVVDSNIDTPAGYGPDSAYLGAHVCNDGSNDLTDVLVNIGNFDPDGVNDGLDPGTPDPTGVPTPGVFPVEDVDEAANGWGYSGDFSFTLESSLSDATRYLPFIPAGECVTQYWLVSYPNLDANGDPVFGANTPLDDDLVLEYDIWATADDSGTDLAADATYAGTMRNEISASANKIYPNNDAKVPDEYLAIIEANLGWRAQVSTATAGTGAVIEGIWYDMGNVNQGFDNDGDLVPDYNLWLQPIGDASRYDGDCFRLVSVTGLLIVKLNDGTNQLIQIEDQLYFENLPENNTGIVGLVYYEWVPIEGGCSGELTPYQEAASGRDNEKFNADFGAFGASIQSTDPNVNYQKAALDPATGLPITLPLPGDTIEYSLSIENLGSSGLGVPLTGAGLVIRDSIPAGMVYVAGSADANNTLPAGTAANTLFSTDGGVTWQVDEPAVAADVTDIQWHLSEPLASGQTATVTFQVMIPTDYTGGTVDNCAETSIGTGNEFDEDCETVVIGGNNSLSGTVFLDDGAGGGTFADGTQDGTEGGIADILVSLYVDKNGDGLLDAGDVLVATVDSATTTGDYSFTGLPDGNFLVVVDSGDTDLPAGTGLTTPGEIAVSLDPDGTDANPVTSTDNDFGFAPPLSIDKSVPTPVYEGQEITYSIKVKNHLVGKGGGGSTLYWSKTATNETWTANTDGTDASALVFNLARSYSIDPLGGRMYYNTSTQIYSADLDGANTTLLYDGSNPAIDPWYLEFNPSDGYVYFTDSINFSLHRVHSSGGPVETLQTGLSARPRGIDIWNGVMLFYSTGGSIVSTDLMGNELSSIPLPGGAADDLEIDDRYAYLTYFNTSGPSNERHVARVDLNFGTYEVLYDVTATVGETVVAIDPDTGTIWWVGRSGGGDIYRGSMDGSAAAELIYAEPGINASVQDIDFVGGSGVFDPASTIYDVTLVDTYHPSELEFLSASVTPDTIDTGTATLTWNDIGPIEAQETTTVNVTFKVLYGNAGQTIDNQADITTSSFYDGTPGNTPSDTEQFTLDPAGSISGNIWSEGTGGTTGWVGTTGHESGTDFGVEGVTVELYACVWNAGANDAGNTVDAADADYESDSDCDSQGSGSGEADWQLIATTTTDANGNYIFDALTSDGFYYVDVDASTIPGTVTQTAESDEFQGVNTGYTCTSAPADYTCDTINGVLTRGGGGGSQPGELNGSYYNELDVSASEDITNWSFGFDVPPALYGNVWEDVDGDGVQDAGEEGLSGWTVSITGPGCAPCTTTTDANGDYQFENLSVGTYTITVTTPAGETWTQTFETDGTINNSTSDALVSGEISGSWDFAFQQTGSSTIGDTVYYDFNGDGTQQAGDEGVAGVTVYLYEDEDGDGVVDPGVDALVGSTTTAADGSYSFTGLPAGDYTVVVDESSSALAGTTQTADPDESGMTCESCDGTGASTVDGTNSDLTQDFGYRPVGTASIGDTVFVDNNGDGAQGASDAGIADITVELWADLNGDGTFGLVATTTTDADGNYLFENLPADGVIDYQVRVDTTDTDIPTSGTGSSYVPTTATTVDVDNLADGASFLDADFGFGPLASIGDTVYWDTNQDGTQDLDEPGIAGVTVSLTPPAGVDLGNGPGVAVTTTTDADGKYLFEDLPAGDYTVDVIPNTGNLGSEPQTGDPDRDGVACADNTYPTLPACDDSYTVTVAVGSVDLSADFGYQPSGVIGDRVWRDLNNDGVQDPGEVGIEGVTVTLTPPAGVDLGNGPGVAITTTTDADGLYSFINLPDATGYTISVGTPTDHTATYDADSGTTSPDSSVTFNMAGGQVDNGGGNTWCPAGSDCSLDLDFGFDLNGENTLAGNVCLDDASSDGTCGTGGEAPLEGQEVYLWDLGPDGVVGGGDDLLLGSTTTSSTGDYSFDGLPDGTYAAVVGTTSEPLSLTTATTTTTNPNHPDVVSVTDTGTSIIQVLDVDSAGTQSALNIVDVDFAFELDQPLDLGDLPALYPTLLSDSGAAHIVDAADPFIRLGGGVTNETDGQPDAAAAMDAEEDGITFVDIASWSEGTVAGGNGGTLAVSFQGVSSSQATASAWLVGWIDFNGDGDFLDAGEMIVNQSVTDTDAADTDSVNLTVAFDVPAGTMLTGSYYSRFRLFRSQPGVSELAFSGTVTGGEVEDYQIDFEWDYGDAPESYSTLYGDGPRHYITPGLRLGAAPDREGDGQPVAPDGDNNGANGDGLDEDGVDIGSLVLQTSQDQLRASLAVTSVVNDLTVDAQLVCWGDFNQDGDFADAGERSLPDFITNSLSGSAAGDTFYATRETNTGAGNAAQALCGPDNTGGTNDALSANLSAGDSINLTFGDIATCVRSTANNPGSMPIRVPAGSTITVYARGNASGSGTATLSAPGVTFTGTSAGTSGNQLVMTTATTVTAHTFTTSGGDFTTFTITLDSDDVHIDAVEYVQPPTSCDQSKMTDATFTTGNVPVGCSGGATVQWGSLPVLPMAGTKVYVRCRLTSEASFFSDSSPAPTGAARDGEVEDNQMDPVPTRATVDRFDVDLVPVGSLRRVGGLAPLVEGLEDSRLVGLVRWETLMEQGTAGFDLERRRTGEGWTRLNETMLPGLVVSRQGGEYLWIDTDVEPGATSYRLVEHEVWGTELTHGPWTFDLTVHKSGAAPADLESTKDGVFQWWPWWQLEHRFAGRGRSAPAPDARAVAAKLARRAEDRALELAASALGAAEADLAGLEEKAGSGERDARLVIRGEGLHTIDAGELADALGKPLNNIKNALRRGQVSMSVGGDPLPYLYDSQAEAAVFAAPGFSTSETDDNVVQVQRRSGAVLPAAGGAGPGAGATGTFVDTITVQEEVWLLPWATRDESLDYWYWGFTYAPWTPSASLSFDVPHPAGFGQATLRLELRGASDVGAGDDHRVWLSLGGQALAAEAEWDGFGTAILETHFDPSLLGSGEQVELVVHAEAGGGAPHSLVLIDKLEIDYRRRATAAGGGLWIDAADDGPLTVDGFASPAIRVIEAPDDGARSIERLDLTVVPDAAGGWQVTFDAAAGLAYALGDAPRPARAEPDVGGRLHERGGPPADYLIIAPRELSRGAEALADFRSGSFTPRIVWLDDVYDAFSFGRTSSRAIETFLDYVHSQWHTVPRYVVLLGRGTLDHRDLQGYGESLLPLRLAATPWGLYASDARYADIDGDKHPDFDLGRIPANSDAELLAYVAKLAAWEDAQRPDAFAVVADDPDEAGDFHANSDRTLALLGSYGVPADGLYHPLDPVRASLLAGWGQSQWAAVVYEGHGSPITLGDERYLEVADVEGLAGAAVPPIFSAWTCAVGDSTAPGLMGLADRLVLSPSGGAIASVAPAGLSLDTPAHVLSQLFLEALAGHGESVGGAAAEAHRLSGLGDSYPWMLDIYLVSGDPAVGLADP